MSSCADLSLLARPGPRTAIAAINRGSRSARASRLHSRALGIGLELAPREDEVPQGDLLVHHRVEDSLIESLVAATEERKSLERGELFALDATLRFANRRMHPWYQPR